MPELSRFFGIVITMYSDHNPPHFHIRYGDYEAIFNIDKKIVRGEIPVSVIHKVSNWVDLHKEELLENWERLQNNLEVKHIKPL